jgi:hypothetical protein
MARRLTTAEAGAAFEEVVRGLAKQHLRLRFRRKFGTGALMDATILVKGSVAAPFDRPVSNLLQELPPSLTVTRLTGTAEAPAGEETKTPGTLTIGELVSTQEVEQAFVIQGRKARLLAYFDPTEEFVFVAREVTEVEEERAPKPRPKAAPKRTSGRASARSTGRGRR